MNTHMDATITNVTDKYLRCKADRECRNLVGRFVFYQSAFMRTELMSLWAIREDIKLEAPWGIYDGHESISRYYKEEIGDRADADSEETLKGTMLARNACSEIIIIAEDRQTAQALYVSFGCETRIDKESKEPKSRWVSCKYAVDFIFEDGAWKLWHMRVYPYLDNPFDTCWLEAEAPDYSAEKHSADRPPKQKPYIWTVDAIYPDDQPQLPRPYFVFPNVAPGYVD